MEKDTQTIFNELLTKSGVYSGAENLSEENIRVFYNFALKTIQLFCPICKIEKTFILSAINSCIGFNNYEMLTEINKIYPSIKYFIYNCPTCNSKIFMLFYFNKEKGIIKLAQYPSLYDVTPDELKKYKSNSFLKKADFDEIYKAATCASSGYYVAAYTYMRRVYENLIDNLFNKNIDEIQISNEDFIHKKMNDKIAVVKKYLPFEEDIYSELYSMLSKGIHILTEQECKENYILLNQIILEILIEEQNKKEKLERRNKLKEIHSKIKK